MSAPLIEFDTTCRCERCGEVRAMHMVCDGGTATITCATCQQAMQCKMSREEAIELARLQAIADVAGVVEAGLRDVLFASTGPTKH